MSLGIDENHYCLAYKVSAHSICELFCVICDVWGHVTGVNYCHSCDRWGHSDRVYDLCINYFDF